MLLRRFRAVPGLQVVHLSPGMPVEKALDRYRGDPNVAYAEPDAPLQILETVPNDPSFSSLWAMKNTGQAGGKLDGDIDATDAWSLSIGSNSVYVGVIDTGVDYAHPDLAGNIYSSPSDCNLNGADDDADGYVDDCHGIDTANHDSDPMDDYDHGTHVSGIIGAIGDNGIGVVGVNWRVTIIPCKFAGSSGTGLTSAAIECLDWLATLKDHGLNIVATNNSWGSSESSQALADAIAANMQRGILFLAAAGNGGSDGIGDDNDSVATYPANYALPNVLAVAATDRNDLRAAFSNFGQHSVHLGAPGVSILSTIRNNSYAALNGTSMATPHVTGAAALLKAQNPALDWRALKNLLLSSTEPVAAFAEKTITGGRLNVYSAMTCSDKSLLAPLSPFGNVTATPGASIDFAALNINCAQAAGDVTVSIDSGAEAVVLRDAGANGDAAAGDGIYTAQWSTTAAGNHTYAFPVGSGGTIRVLAPYAPPTLTGYSYRSITGSNLQLSDESVASLNLNTPGLFPVAIGGATFDTLSISANGVLSLDNFSAFTNSPIPAANAHVLVAPWWDDLAPQSGTDHNVFYEVTGAAPNRELVIEWRNVPQWATAADPAKAVTFQVVFPESAQASDILFNYADVTFDDNDESDYNSGGSATVGVQIDSVHGVQYSYNQPILTDGLALLFQAVPAPPPAPTLAVVSPNGGESWPLGSPQTIRWSYTATPGATVKIELLRNGSLQQTLAATAAIGANGSGSFRWTPAESLPVDATYTIRITSNQNSSCRDASDAPFSLTAPPLPPTLTLASPSGGETWTLGSSQAIQWSYAGAVGTALKIELLKARSVWSTLSASTPVGSDGAGSFPWNIDAALPQGSDYQVRITSTTDPSITFTGAAFALTLAPSMTLIAPSGGESWQLGSTQIIEWSYTGALGATVNLELLRNGSLQQILATAAPIGSNGTGSFSWTIDAELAAASDYQVRIASTSEPAIASTSASFSLAPASSLTVIAPNGGETWEVGSTQTIRWMYTGTVGTTLQIELFKAGTRHTTLTASTPVGTDGAGSFRWTIEAALAPASDYQVRVTDTTHATAMDTSDGNFSLIPAAALTLISPSGGESWQVGSTHTLQWNYTGSVGAAVKIELMKAGTIVSTLSNSTPMGSAGSGSYSWTIEAGLAAASGYQVRITSTSNPDATMTSAPFTLTPAPSITVVSPNGGESWPADSTHTITWTYTGPVGLAVKIELFRAGNVASTLSASTPVGTGGNGSFSWRIDTALPAGSDYQIRISSTSDTTVADTSDGSFSLDPAPSVTLVAPNGGESWQVGTTHTIQWNYVGSVGPAVRIELLKTGAAMSTLSASTPAGPNGSGSYPWSIDAALAAASDYQIRITSTSAPGITMTSAPFSLTPAPSLALVSPNGGESWTLGSTQTIRWSYAGTPGTTLKIELLRSGSLQQTVTMATPLGSDGVGSLNWTPQTTLPPDATYTIRITSNENPQYSDASDAPFSLAAEPTYRLTVMLAGTGRGTVSGSTIDCGADCTSTYPQGTQVTLNATAAAGSTFTGWSGACTGVEACTVTMDSDKALTATFDAVPSYALAVTLAGNGSGTVSGVDIACGTDCTGTYPRGTQVTLIAAAAEGSTFAGWTGACGGTGTCTVTMDSDKRLTATFDAIPTPSLTVVSPNGGETWMLGSAQMIRWDYTGSVGAEVTIELLKAGVLSSTISAATPVGSSGSGSFNWIVSEALAPASQYQVRVRSTSNVAAVDSSDASFSLLLPNHTLTLTLAGQGNGTVTGADIHCGTDCSGSYPRGTQVTLTATPAVDSRFAGWSGACTGTAACSVLMDSDKALTATFEAIPSYTLRVTLAGSGNGTVTGAEINCGTVCSGTYLEGTQVTLTAAAAEGSRFTGWGGECTGVGSCSVVLNAAKDVSATFDSLPPFEFGPPPPSSTVTAGQVAEFAIVLNGQAGFAGSVSLSCTAGVPPAAACSFDPASLHPGNGTATSTLRITTTARTTARNRLGVQVVLASLIAPLVLLGAGRRRRRGTILAIALALAAVMLGCGGGTAQVAPPPPQTIGTPSGTYSITVSATSGTNARTQVVTLSVK